MEHWILSVSLMDCDCSASKTIFYHNSPGWRFATAVELTQLNTSVNVGQLQLWVKSGLTRNEPLETALL